MVKILLILNSSKAVTDIHLILVEAVSHSSSTSTRAHVMIRKMFNDFIVKHLYMLFFSVYVC